LSKAEDRREKIGPDSFSVQAAIYSLISIEIQVEYLLIWLVFFFLFISLKNA